MFRFARCSARRNSSTSNSSTAVAVLGALAIGIPIGLGLGLLSVRILGLFFTLPAPALTVPIRTLAGFVVLLVATAAVFLAGALVG